MICALYFLFLCCCCLFSYFIVVLFLICVLLFLYGFFLLFFFFSSRRRHTRLVSDWSSDVCSSDLVVRQFLRFVVVAGEGELAGYVAAPVVAVGQVLDHVTATLGEEGGVEGAVVGQPPSRGHQFEIGRASCRERVWSAGVGGAASQR